MMKVLTIYDVLGAYCDVRQRQHAELAQLIADELVTQGNEIDNLGDNESVVLLGKSPCINLVQLAERIIADRGGRHDAGRS